MGLSVQATLPLHNPSDRWVHVHLQTVTVEVDNDRYDPNRFIPFVMKERVIIEPRTTENVKVRAINYTLRIITTAQFLCPWVADIPKSLGIFVRLKMSFF